MKLAHFPCLIMICAAVGMAATAEMPLQWSELPPLPDTPGLGGAFAGAHGDALIVAGGANFPGKPPWEGGVKTYRSSVYLLEKGSKQWRTGGSLSHPTAYGGSVSTKDGLVLIGGRDGETIFSDVLLLKWNAATRTVVQEALPSLPEPAD